MEDFSILCQQKTDRIALYREQKGCVGYIVRSFGPSERGNEFFGGCPRLFQMRICGRLGANQLSALEVWVLFEFPNCSRMDEQYHIVLAQKSQKVCETL